MPKLRMSFERIPATAPIQRAKTPDLRELSAMNDRDLADIGYARGEIRTYFGIASGCLR